MGERTAIEWTEATWNPVTGCSKVSPGCAHCYAETLTRRLHKQFQAPDLPWTPENATRNVILHPERLDQPLRWRRPRMVFVNSMSDLFHEEIPDGFIYRVFEVMAEARQHTFQVLTKRPERMRDLLAHRDADGSIRDDQTAENWWEQPFPNIWLGVSIENRHYVHRADVLREIPAAVRFISAEPLLGTLLMGGGRNPKRVLWPDGYSGAQLNLDGIDWLIAGGESGPRHRPMDIEWVRLLHQATRCSHCEGTGKRPGVGDCPACSGTGAFCAFFFKQWGGLTAKAGGRLLDGRTWDEMPKGKGTMV